MFAYHAGNKFLIFLLGVFLVFSVKGLVKIDAENNVIGGNVNYAMNNDVRQIAVQDIANACVDAADLLSVLNGIALPLLAPNGNRGAANSWLHLPRTKPDPPERLETHLLRGHGPSGGLSQAHIMSSSQFSFGVIAGIQAPANRVGLAIDPNMPLAVGGIVGGGGVPVDQDWDQLQKDTNNVNLPTQTTVLAILATINRGNQVKFQVAPIRGMRKFIIDLNQVSLENCSRPIIYDDQTPLPVVVPPLSEGWLRKQGGQNPWRVSQRPRLLIVSLPSRDAAQVNTVLGALGGNIVFPAPNPVQLQQQATLAIPAALVVDNFGRETQRIPMTIYFGR